MRAQQSAPFSGMARDVLAPLHISRCVARVSSGFEPKYRRIQRLGCTHRIEIFTQEGDLAADRPQEQHILLLIEAPCRLDPRLRLHFGDGRIGISAGIHLQTWPRPPLHWWGIPPTREGSPSAVTPCMAHRLTDRALPSRQVRRTPGTVTVLGPRKTNNPTSGRSPFTIAISRTPPVGEDLSSNPPCAMCAQFSRL